MTCLDGSVLPNGQQPFEKYWCGQSTNYEWNPVDKVPACVSALSRPEVFGTQASVSYTSTIADSDISQVQTSVVQKASDVGCVQSGVCTVTSSVQSSVSNVSRKRRSSGSTLTLQFTITLSEEGDLGIADYLASGTQTPAMAELLTAVNSINDAIEFVQNNTESIFQTSVSGVAYTLEDDSTRIVAMVTCPSGYAGAGGLCTLCPTGTMLIGLDCLDCEVGTFQPETGQTSCLPCPSGYTTPTYGASNMSECSVLLDIPTTQATDDDEHYDNGESDGNKSDELIIIIVCSSVAACLVLGISYVLWRRCIVTRCRVGSFSRDDVGNISYRTKSSPQLEHKRLPPIMGASTLEPSSVKELHLYNKLPPIATTQRQPSDECRKSQIEQCRI